jgi:hypothetical protein
MPLKLKSLKASNTFANIAARNSIPIEDRFDGMRVNVLDDGNSLYKAFQLQGGVDNSNWVDLNIILENGVDTIAIVDGAVTTEKIADGAITTEKIENNATTNEKLADMPEATLKGRSAGSGTGDPEDLTREEASVILINDVGLTATDILSAEEIQNRLNTALTSALFYKGGYDVNTNTPDLTTPIAGIKTGFTYTCTSNGTFFGELLEPGDTLIAEVDDPSSLVDWTIVQDNLTPASIKTNYESNPDTNPFTDADKNKLDNIDSNVTLDGDVTGLADNNVIEDLALTKLQDVNAYSFLGRGNISGNVEALTYFEAQDILGLGTIRCIGVITLDLEDLGGVAINSIAWVSNPAYNDPQITSVVQTAGVSTSGNRFSITVTHTGVLDSTVIFTSMSLIHLNTTGASEDDRAINATNSLKLTHTSYDHTLTSFKFVVRDIDAGLTTTRYLIRIPVWIIG